jgi:hypothetical protein
MGFRNGIRRRVGWVVSGYSGRRLCGAGLLREARNDVERSAETLPRHREELVRRGNPGFFLCFLDRRARHRARMRDPATRNDNEFGSISINSSCCKKPISTEYTVSLHIDAWTHIFPPVYFAHLQTIASAAGPLKRWLQLTPLYDLERRFRLMDAFDDYQQILTPSMPPIEDLAEGQRGHRPDAPDERRSRGTRG